MRGTVPPDLLQWAKASLTPPEIDWRKALSAKIRHAVASKSGATDYTRRKVSRRQWAMRAAFGKNAPVLPSLHSPVPEITVVVDKSASMTGRLEAALSEVVGILKAVNAPVKVMAADMNAHKSIKVSGGRDLKTFAQADGGTDMRVGIREASEDKACNVIILLTDGETPWPTLAEMPRQLVIVGLVTTEEGAKWLQVPDHIKKRSVMIKLDKSKY